MYLPFQFALLLSILNSYGAAVISWSLTYTHFSPLLCLHPTVLIHIYNIIPLSPSPASHFQACLAPPDVFFFSFFFVKSTYFQPYLCLAASIKPSGCEEEKEEARLRPKMLFWWFPALICSWGWTQSFVFCFFFGILYCLPQNANAKCSVLQVDINLRAKRLHSV